MVDYLDRMDGVIHLDGFHFLAGVSVAGSNPVVRSKRSWSVYVFSERLVGTWPKGPIGLPR